MAGEIAGVTRIRPRPTSARRRFTTSLSAAGPGRPSRARCTTRMLGRRTRPRTRSIGSDLAQGQVVALRVDGRVEADARDLAVEAPLGQHAAGHLLHRLERAGLIGRDAPEEQVVLDARRRAEARLVVELDRRISGSPAACGRNPHGRRGCAPPGRVRAGRGGAGSRCSAGPGRSGAPGPGRSGRCAAARSCGRRDPGNRAGRRRRRRRSARRAAIRPGSPRRSRSCWWRSTGPSGPSGLVSSLASRIARTKGWPARRSSRKASPIGFPNSRFSPIVA